jgi:hypothetical protein
MSKFTYHDGSTHTPCRTRKQAIAFLIAQNGGEVRKDGKRVAWIHPEGYLVTTGRFSDANEARQIYPAMRQAAQKEIGKLVPRKYYLIDFVYAETGQQFGTGADLTPAEFVMMEKYLRELEADGWLTDPHVHEPGASVHQTYAQARKEIAAALRS